MPPIASTGTTVAALPAFGCHRHWHILLARGSGLTITDHDYDLSLLPASVAKETRASATKDQLENFV